MHYLGSPRFQGGNRGNALSNCTLIGWPPRSSLPHPSEVRSRPASHYSLSSPASSRCRPVLHAFALLVKPKYGLSGSEIGFGLCCRSNRQEWCGIRLFSCFLKANLGNEHFCFFARVLFARAERRLYGTVASLTALTAFFYRQKKAAK